MKKNRISLGFVPTLVLAVIAFSVPGKAQPDDQPDTSERLKVQHVRAAMMFWWLTGERDKQEKYFDNQDSRTANPLTDLLKPTIPLPGLRKLAFDSATNELIASGAPEGVKELRDALEFLDRPVRKVELQVQVIEIDETYLNQSNWLAKDRGAAVTHNSESTKFFPKIMPEQKLTVVISDYRSEEFQLFLTAAREQKRVSDIQTHRIEVLNNFKTKLSVEENAISLGWEMALTPTIQYDDTVTLFCSPQLKTANAQMRTTVANLKQKDIMLFESEKLEQPGRVLLFAVSVLEVAPQPE